MTEDEDPE